MTDQQVIEYMGEDVNSYRDVDIKLCPECGDNLIDDPTDNTTFCTGCGYTEA